MLRLFKCILNPSHNLYKQKNKTLLHPRFLYSQIDLQIDKFTNELSDESSTNYEMRSLSVRRKLIERPILHTRNFSSILNKLENNADDNNFLLYYVRSIVRQRDDDINPVIFKEIGKRMLQYFHLKQLDNLALRFYNDDNLQFLFFMEFNCQIFFDLLYKRKRFDKILHCYKEIHSKHIRPSKYVFHLMIAACYKSVCLKSVSFL